MEKESRLKIKIGIGRLGESQGELIKFMAPRTVDAIIKALPIQGKAALWNEEVYFTIPVKVGPEKSKSRVETGALAYWPVGSAFCIFYGKSQPYSPVNVVGRVMQNLELFRSVKKGAIVYVKRYEE